jgi:hypothetical protein
MPIRVLLGSPLQHGGLGPPIIAERCGSRGHPPCPHAEFCPRQHCPSEGLRPFAAIAFGEHLVAVLEGPVEVGIGAKATVKPQDGAAPLGWRQGQHAFHSDHRGA